MRSLILPGWGQVSTRHRRTGWLLVVLTLVIVGLAVLAVVSLGAVETAARLADPDVLLVVLGANIVVAFVRLASTVHAWWAGGGRSWLTGGLLALLVLSPHVALAWVGTEIRGTLVNLFAAADEPQPAPPATTTPPPAPSTTAPPPTTSTTTSTTSSTTPSTTTVPTTTTVPVTTTTIPFEGERFNLLLLGGDAGPGRPGLRTDTIMIASVDPSTGDAALIGLPRNYGGLTFSDGTPFPGRILNEVYQWGRDNPDAFGGDDPGASAIADVAQHLTGLDIDHFMLVDLTGFADVVDAFGGVTLSVPHEIYGPLYDPESGGYEMVTIPVGDQTLTGAEALAYSRARLGSSDYARMSRQRCVLSAMVSGADPVHLLTGVPDLLDVVETHLTTDVPIDLVPELIRLLPDVSAGDIRVVGFDHTWREGKTADGYSIPDLERIRSAVDDVIDDSAAAADLGGDSASEACD